MDDAVLRNRDYTFIIAKTADESAPNPPHFAERWGAAQEAIRVLTQHCEALDPDGVTVYIAGRDETDACSFSRHEKLTSQALMQVLAENYPPCQVILHQVLETAMARYFQRKAQGQSQPNGEIILVILDGEPEDRMAVVRVIKDATEQMETEHELRLSFVQIGEDAIATGFLTALDENLKADAGARFDIVCSQQLQEIQPDSITSFLFSTL